MKNRAQALGLIGFGVVEGSWLGAWGNAGLMRLGVCIGKKRVPRSGKGKGSALG